MIDFRNMEVSTVRIEHMRAKSDKSFREALTFSTKHLILTSACELYTVGAIDKRFGKEERSLVSV